MKSEGPVQLRFGKTSAPFQAANSATQCSAISPRRDGLMTVGPGRADLSLAVKLTFEL